MTQNLNNLDFAGSLNNLEGKAAGFDEEGNQRFIRLLPKELLLMNMEIAIHHPILQELLNEGLRDDAYSPDSYFGIIFAYCGIALDSTNTPHGYRVDELIEQGTRALIAKRSETGISVNTMPSMQALVGHMLDMKKGAEHADAMASEITLDSNISKLN